MMRKRGYTLIEIIVVVAIIGLLVTIMGISYTESLAKARDSRRVSDLSSIKSALELYKADNYRYPTVGGTTHVAGCLTKSCTNNSSEIHAAGLDSVAEYEANWAQFTLDMHNYMPIMPQDPKVGFLMKKTANYALIPFSYFYFPGEYPAYDHSKDGKVYNLFARPAETSGVYSECEITDPNWPTEAQNMHYICIHNQ